MTKSFSVTVCLGQRDWIGHCLDLDIVTQASSVSEAADALIESLGLIFEDLDDPTDFKTYSGAPEEYWLPFQGFPWS